MLLLHSQNMFDDQVLILRSESCNKIFKFGIFSCSPLPSCGVSSCTHRIAVLSAHSGTRKGREDHKQNREEKNLLLLGRSHESNKERGKKKIGQRNILLVYYFFDLCYFLFYFINEIDLVAFETHSHLTQKKRKKKNGLFFFFIVIILLSFLFVIILRRVFNLA